MVILPLTDDDFIKNANVVYFLISVYGEIPENYAKICGKKKCATIC